MKKITKGSLILGLCIFAAGCGKDKFENLTPPNTPGIGVETAASTPDSTSTMVCDYSLTYPELAQMVGISIDTKMTVIDAYDAPYTSGTHRITLALAEFIKPMSKQALGSNMNAVGLWGDINGWRWATLKETENLLSRWGSARPDSIWIVCMGSSLKNGIGTAVQGSYFAFGKKEDDPNASYGIWYVNPGAVWGSDAMQEVMGGNAYRVLMVRR